MDKPSALGRALRIARTRQNLTRRELVDRAQEVDTGYAGEGLSTSSLNRSETGARSPRVHELIAICEVLGISMVEFFQLYHRVLHESGGTSSRPPLPASRGDSRLGARMRRLLAELDLELETEASRLHVHFHLPPEPDGES